MIKISCRKLCVPCGVVVLFASVLAGCGKEAEGLRTGSGRQSSIEAPAQDQSQRLATIPPVDLSQIEPHAAERFRAAKVRLDTAAVASRGTAFGRLGMMYHAYELWDAAVACYMNAELLEAKDYRWSYLLAHAQQADGQLAKAIESFRRAKKQLEQGAAAPTDARKAVHCSLGLALLDSNQFTDAEQEFTRALALRDDDGFTLYALGRVAVARRQFERARTFLEQADRLLPDTRNIQYLLGTVYRELGQSDEAESYLRRGVVARQNAGPSDPLLDAVNSLADSSQKLRARGNLLFQAGRFREARDTYEKALAINSGNARTHCNLGSTLQHLGDIEGAEREFRQALRLDVGLAAAHFNLGVIRAQQGSNEQAVQQYEAALQIDPRHKNARFNLANAMARRGRYREAEIHYGKVLEVDPAHTMSILGVARTLVLAGKYADAAKCLETGLAILPDELTIQRDLARLLAAAPDDSVRDGKRGLVLALAVARRQSHINHVETIAMSHAELGNFDDAISVQQAAIQAAEQAGRQDLVLTLTRNLDLYQRGEHCRTPFHDYELRPQPIVAAAATRSTSQPR